MFTRDELETLNFSKLKKIVEYMKLDIDFKVCKTKDDLIDAIIDLTDIPSMEQSVEEPLVSVRVKRIRELKKRGLL